MYGNCIVQIKLMIILLLVLLLLPISLLLLLILWQKRGKWVEWGMREAKVFEEIRLQGFCKSIDSKYLTWNVFTIWLFQGKSSSIHNHKL